MVLGASAVVPLRGLLGAAGVGDGAHAAAPVGRLYGIMVLSMPTKLHLATSMVRAINDKLDRDRLLDPGASFVE